MTKTTAVSFFLVLLWKIGPIVTVVFPNKIFHCKTLFEKSKLNHLALKKINKVYYILQMLNISVRFTITINTNCYQIVMRITIISLESKLSPLGWPIFFVSRDGSNFCIIPVSLPSLLIQISGRKNLFELNILVWVGRESFTIC